MTIIFLKIFLYSSVELPTVIIFGQICFDLLVMGIFRKKDNKTEFFISIKLNTG
jgi:hypothetical protein